MSVPTKKLSALEFFEEGKRFTEELLKENEHLRLIIAKVKTEKRDLSKRLELNESNVPQSKIDVLTKENEELKAEIEQLRNQFNNIEDENHEFADRYVQVEKQNSDLISLYVASYQLHCTLEFDAVIEAVKDIVINLVGAEEFAIYLLENESQQLHLLTEEGVSDLVQGKIAVGEGIIGQAGESGQVYIEEGVGGGQRNKSSEPIACIPLRIGDDVTGVVSIHSLLSQKQGLEALDYELFELLGNHAATALYAARMYMVSERKRNTLEGFLKLMKAEMLDGAQAGEKI